jgi:hypothetical protein
VKMNIESPFINPDIGAGKSSLIKVLIEVSTKSRSLCNADIV